MMPPLLLGLRVITPTGRNVRLWLPLFLLWLILLPLVVLVALTTALVDVVLLFAGRDYHHYTLLLLRSLEVLGATRGTTVRVHSDTTDVNIDFV
jgi:hypothetical protein